MRCVAPARNATLPWIQAIESVAHSRLVQEGFIPTLGERIADPGPYDSSPPAARIHDLHAAFADSEVKAILSLIGGYNSNQLLRMIDYDLIAKNPKILCGYSDITALTHAVYSQTGLVTYSGPHFFNFGELSGADYTVHYFRECVMHSTPYVIEPCVEWSSDLWARDQHNRTFIQNKGPVVFHEGDVEGISLGGNLRTFMQLSGTRFWPGLEGAILFVEDYDQVSPQILDQLLESLASQADFEGLQGLAFGRFHPHSQIDIETLREIISSKKVFSHLPIVADLDFGHTHPIFTFPIGGTVHMKVLSEMFELSVIQH